MRGTDGGTPRKGRLGATRPRSRAADANRPCLGEDPDDVGAPADLLIDALQRIGRAELGPVFGREGVEGVGRGLWGPRASAATA
jgi:hypothetical protein